MPTCIIKVLCKDGAGWEVLKLQENKELWFRTINPDYAKQLEWFADTQTLVVDFREGEVKKWATVQKQFKVREGTT